MNNPWNRSAEVQSQATRAVDQGLRSYMLRIYNYMASGVLLTGLVAYGASQWTPFLNAVMKTNAEGMVTGLSPLGWLVAFAPVVFVLLFGRAMSSANISTLKTTFWAYAGVMGLSLFSIFLAYTGASIMRVFFITAGTFGLFSIYGYTTKKDLTSWGSFLFIGIWAVFIASIANMFMHSSGFSLVLSLVGVGLAIGLIAFNTQKLKDVYYAVGRSGDTALERASIMGALQLYFDFIYLFINLLRIMGDRR